jgi:hypothetical protein
MYGCCGWPGSLLDGCFVLRAAVIGEVSGKILVVETGQNLRVLFCPME